MWPHPCTFTFFNSKLSASDPNPNPHSLHHTYTQPSLPTPTPTPSPCITLSFASASAPRFSSSCTICRCPLSAARINAVSPSCIQGGEHSQEEGGNGASPLVAKDARVGGVRMQVGGSMKCVCVCVCVCVDCVWCGPPTTKTRKIHRTKHNPVVDFYHPSHHYAHTKPSV